MNEKRRGGKGKRRAEKRVGRGSKDGRIEEGARRQGKEKIREMGGGREELRGV
jgi:hypothetical protein